MAKAFTAKTVEAFKPDLNKRLEIADGGAPGLYLVIQSSGSKSWAMRFRAGGKTAKLTLGILNVEAPTTAPGGRPQLGGYLTLAEARILVAEQRHALAQGINPAATKIELVRAERLEHVAKTSNLVRNVAADFIRRHVTANGLRSAEEITRQFRKHILPAWEDKAIEDIKKRDVIALIDGISENAPIMANRVLATVRKFFSWCEGRDIIRASPCSGIAMPGAETSRSRVLNDSEIKLFWIACDSVGEPFGRLFQILLLTGQRRDEVANMTASEINLESMVWTLPSARAKNKKEHMIPLSDEAVNIFKSVKRIAGNPDFIFSTNGRTPVSGFSKAKQRVADRMDEIRPNGTEKITTWTLHDLRRTAATGMARLNIPVHVVESVLNHRSGSIRGVAAVYNRYEYDKEKRHALQAWSDEIDRIVIAPQQTIAGKFESAVG